MAATGTALVVAPGARAKVFATQKEALAAAFPDADRVEPRTWVLSEDQAHRIESLSRSQLETRLVTIYTAWKRDAILGYAHIDVHVVRTKPEAFMVVLKPDGVVRSVRILAFHEPLDYLPSERWYHLFDDKSSADALRVGHDVQAVVGATLSARAAAGGVRRVLAYYQVLIHPAPAS